MPLGVMSSNPIIARKCPICDSNRLRKDSAILMPFVAHRALDWKPVQINGDWGLNTIKKGMAYSVCNSVLCNECHLLFLDIRFSDAELSSLYENYRGTEYVNLREFYEPGYRDRNQLLNDLADYINGVEGFLSQYVSPRCRILDWGGDTGKNTPFGRKSSLLHIYDISKKPVIEGAMSVDRQTASSTNYDLIICSQVLEHLPWPCATLSEIRECMQKDTVLYIELPLENIIQKSSDPYCWLKEKKHWHEHINFFSEKSILKLLRGLDLDLIDIKQSQITVGGKSPWIFQVICRKKTM